MENGNPWEERLTKKEARRKFRDVHRTLVNEQVSDYVLLKDVNKVYPGNVQAVYDFNLGIEKNEFVVLVGPSGCGKSTTLRMIAGLEEISSGYFYIDKVLSNDRTPKERDVAMVFQNYALYPHMNVYDNISFGLKLRKESFPVLDEEGKQKEGVDRRRILRLRKEILKKSLLFWDRKAREEKKERKKELEEARTAIVPLFVTRHYTKEEIDAAVFRAAKILDLGTLLDRKPRQLSGGQMQRVALGRAIVRRPKLFLMDEPLSNLDAKLRVQMRSEIVSIHKEVQATTIYVTHDQTEAMTMADKVVVMNKGFVQQVGTPMEIYRHPYNVFVATFIGSPSMNIHPATYEEGTLSLGEETIALPESFCHAHDVFYDAKRSYWADILSRFDGKAEQESLAKAKELLSLLHEKGREEEVLSQAEELFAHDGFSPERRGLLDRTRKDIQECLAAKNLRPLSSLLKEWIKILQEKDPAISQSLAQLKSHAIFENERKGEQEKTKERKISDDELLQQERREVETIVDAYRKDALGRHDIQIGLRPEDLRLAKVGEERSYPARVNHVELLGSEYLLHVTLFGREWLAKVPCEQVIQPGDTIALTFPLEKLHLFDPVSSLAIC